MQICAVVGYLLQHPSPLVIPYPFRYTTDVLPALLDKRKLLFILLVGHKPGEELVVFAMTRDRQVSRTDKHHCGIVAGKEIDLGMESTP